MALKAMTMSVFGKFGGGGNLLLLSSDRVETSCFSLVERTDYSLTLLGYHQDIQLKLVLVPKKSDLFGMKTKYTNAWDIQNGRLEVGDDTYGFVRIVDGEYGSKVKIGNFCSIASGVMLFNAYHRTDLLSSFPFQALNRYYSDQPILENDHVTKGEIVIGNDVWLGHGVSIMSGVTIGDGAVIAANAVVTKDVSPYAIVGGNPAKHLKYRQPHATYAHELQKIAWWNWSEEKIEANIAKIMSSDIKAFVEEFYPKAPS